MESCSMDITQDTPSLRRVLSALKKTEGASYFWEAVIDGRLKQLQKVCEASDMKLLEGSRTESHLRYHLVLDRNHSAVYCGIEKIASTFWRRLFWVLADETKGTPFNIGPELALNGGEIFAKFSLQEAIYWLLHSKQRFLFVREPYSRLFSGYVDKLLSPNPVFWGSVGKFVVGTFRPNASQLSLDCGHDVTFAEFIQYVIHAEETGNHRDGHFLPIYDHCKPCFLNYNIIGKMETFQNDTFFILDKLNASAMKANMSNFSLLTLIDTVNDVVSAVFGVKGAVSKCLTFYGALQRIWSKLQARGIIESRFNLPISADNADDLQKSDFTTLVMEAAQKSDPRVLKMQKRQILADAYKTTSISDIRKIQKLFGPDFDLFGYEKNPDYMLSW